MMSQHFDDNALLWFGKILAVDIEKEVLDGSRIDVWTPDGWCVFVSHQSNFTNAVFETVGGIQESAEQQAYHRRMSLTSLIEYWAVFEP